MESHRRRRRLRLGVGEREVLISFSTTKTVAMELMQASSSVRSRSSLIPEGNEERVEEPKPGVAGFRKESEATGKVGRGRAVGSLVGNAAIGAGRGAFRDVPRTWCHASTSMWREERTGKCRAGDPLSPWRADRSRPRDCRWLTRGLRVTHGTSAGASATWSDR